jgi:hypothetical protein
VGFISAFQILPRHVSANGGHLQGVVAAYNMIGSTVKTTKLYLSYVTMCFDHSLLEAWIRKCGRNFTCIIQDYYKSNRHFQGCIETKLLMI